MKKLILVLIMILLGSSWIAVADEELDDIIVAEEGSGYYNPELGANFLNVDQNYDTKHTPSYTSQELNEVQQMMAVSPAATNFAFLEPAAAMTTYEAITATTKAGGGGITVYAIKGADAVGHSPFSSDSTTWRY